MNVTINIYGDVHIHCDCCNECGVYDDNLRRTALEAPHEAAPDAEDGGEEIEPDRRRSGSGGKGIGGVVLFRFFPEETDEGGGAHEGI